VHTISAAGLSVSHHVKAELCQSVTVGLFNACGPLACRDIPSLSCSIWSVGVCDNCRETIWRCRWNTV